MAKNNRQSLEELNQKIIAFNTARGWHQSASDLAKSVVIEAAELLEHFQWDESHHHPKVKDLNEVGNEMADVVWYIFLLCQNLGINLADALDRKYDHNDQKYPAQMFTTGSNDEFYYSQKEKYRSEKKNP